MFTTHIYIYIYCVMIPEYRTIQKCVQRVHNIFYSIYAEYIKSLDKSDHQVEISLFGSIFPLYVSFTKLNRKMLKMSTRSFLNPNFRSSKNFKKTSPKSSYNLNYIDSETQKFNFFLLCFSSAGEANEQTLKKDHMCKMICRSQY